MGIREPTAVRKDSCSPIPIFPHSPIRLGYPSAALYGDDGFHPSYLGALAAAETIYAMLFDVPAARIPDLDDAVPPGTRAILREAVAASMAQWGRH